MTGKEIEEAGREMLILQALARLSAYRQEIQGYLERYGSYEQLEALVAQTEEEDFEGDDALNAWRWAREQIEDQQDQLRALGADAA